MRAKGAPYAAIPRLLTYLIDPRGRSGKRAYFFSWVSIVVSGWVTILAALLWQLANYPSTYGTDVERVAGNIGILFLAWLFVPIIRRCHDLEWSGLVSLLILVPIVNLVFFVVLFLKKSYVWNTAAGFIARCKQCQQEIQSDWELCAQCRHPITGEEWASQK
ncbi:MAG: DUF805 domain-containing protein [Dehalococcoidia bacterium]